MYFNTNIPADPSELLADYLANFGPAQPVYQLEEPVPVNGNICHILRIFPQGYKNQVTAWFSSPAARLEFIGRLNSACGQVRR